MPSKSPKGTVYDDGLRQRLRLVVRQHSQAEIVRATETSHPNVSRYLRHQKIPAEFLARLSSAFALNPTWLLTGEGSPDLSQIGEGAGQMAKEMNDLIETMEYIAQSSVGGFDSSQREESLVNLSESLERHQELEVKMKGVCRESFQDLLNSLTSRVASALDPHSTISVDLDDPFVRACQRLSRFVSADQRIEFENVLAQVYNLQNMSSRALESAEKSVHLAGELGDMSREDVFFLHFNYAISLFNHEYTTEALSYIRYVLDRFSDLRETVRYRILRYYKGLITFRLGDFWKGYSQMTEAWVLFSNEERVRNRLVWHFLGAQVVARIKSFAEVLSLNLEAVDEHLREEYQTLTLVLFSQLPMTSTNREFFKEAYSRLVDVRGMPIFTKARVTALSQAMNGNPEALKKFLEKTASLVDRNKVSGTTLLRISVTATQVALLLNDAGASKKHFADSKKHLDALQPGHRPPVQLMSIHHSNALQLYSGKVHVDGASAKRFFEDCIKTGFTYFEDVLADQTI